VSVADRTFSPRELADAIGVSESSLKRWVDSGELAAMRTAGGHRRISLSEAVRFIRGRNLVLVQPAVLGLADLARIPEELADARVTPDLLLALFESEQSHCAGGLLVASYLRGEPLAALFDGPIRLTMHRAGGLWKASRRGILVEHRATQVVIQALREIRALVPPPPSAAPIAVGSAAEGDPYVIPSLMASVILADLGYRVVDLGPDTPSDVLALEARERGVSLVWLSASTASEDTVRRSVTELTTSLEGTGTLVVVGGRATEGASFEGVLHRQSMQELREAAQGLPATR
jgi:MerR family transcriptional regulator, light-induced transcriptional regulator